MAGKNVYRSVLIYVFLISLFVFANFSYALGALTEVAAIGGRGNIAIDGADNMFIPMYSDNKVIKVTPAGAVSDFATGMTKPRGAVFDSSGNLYVGDFNGNVWRIAPNGSKGTIAVSISSIGGLAIDSTSTYLYVTSQYDNNIYRITLATNVRTIFSGVFAAAAEFATKMLSKVILDPAGDLYVTTFSKNASPAGGPKSWLNKVTQASPGTYTIISTLDERRGNSYMLYGSLFWSEAQLYTGSGSTWIPGAYRSPIFQVNEGTGAVTTFFDPPGNIMLSGMAYDSTGQLFVTGTKELSGVYTNHLYRFDNPDADNDGVDSAVEDAAPNDGDGNGDGTKDSEQTNVASLPSAVGGGYFTVEETTGACLLEFVATSLEGAGPLDALFDYPMGLVAFELPCDEATVRIYFHGLAQLRRGLGYTYRKYGPTPPAFDGPSQMWYRMPAHTFRLAWIGGQLVYYVEFILRDGELGDDTGVDGRIVDQGGPAPGLGIPAMNVWGLGIFAALTLAGSVYYIRRRKRLEN